MKKTFLVLLFVFFSASTYAICPVVPIQFDQVLALVKSSTSCPEAYKIAAECTFEDERDQEVSAAAIHICSRNYNYISGIERADYDSLSQDCKRKAHCHLKLAELFFIVYGK